MDEDQHVYIVDDDDALRESMRMLLEMLGYRVQVFASPKSFLAVCSDSDRGCLVLDMRLPEMTGLELQQALRKRGYDLPIIFLSGFGDAPTTARAYQLGGGGLPREAGEQAQADRVHRARLRDRAPTARRCERGARALSDLDATRVVGDGVGNPRAVKQGHRARAGDQPAHGRDPPGKDDGEDGGRQPRDAVLSRPVTTQRFQTIPGRTAKEVERCRCMQLSELALS